MHNKSQSKGMSVRPGRPQLVAGLKAVGKQIAEEWSKKAGADGEAIRKALK